MQKPKPKPLSDFACKNAAPTDKELCGILGDAA
jgi:hypothetical protein